MLVLVAGGLLLTPAVQRRVLLRAVQAQPGLKVEVTTVSAGLSHLRLGGVRLEQSGLTVQVGQLEADYSLWRLLLKRQLVVGRLSGRGLFIDASRLSAARANAAAAGAPAATPPIRVSTLNS